MDAHDDTERGPLRLVTTAIAIVSATTFLVAGFLTINWAGGDIVLYLRDPAATFGFTPFAGLFSHIGVFALATAGVIGIFAFFHVHQDKSLLLWAGLFSLLIAIDDFFMLHENIVPRVLGISEAYVLAFYGLFSFVIFAAFRSSLTGKAHVGLYAALSLLAASVLCDIVMVYSERQVMLEDSLKFSGLLVWSTYWVRRAHHAVVACQNAHLMDIQAAKGGRASSATPRHEACLGSSSRRT